MGVDKTDTYELLCCDAHCKKGGGVAPYNLAEELGQQGEVWRCTSA
jgi:hypothetical protein